MRSFKRAALRLAHLGRIIALDGISTLSLDPADIQNPAEMTDAQTAQVQFAKEFQDDFQDLLNNVRVNLPQKLKGVTDGVQELAEVTSMPPQDIADSASQIQQQVTTTNSQIDSSANNATNLISTIVQELNDIKKALNS